MILYPSMELGVERTRAVLLRSLCRHAEAHRAYGPLAWMLIWYHPTSFDGLPQQPNDEMNVAMSQAAGWVWGPF